MPKVAPSILATVWLLSFQATVDAAPIPIEFVPQDQTVELGNQVSVDVVVTPGLDFLGLPVLVTEFDMIVNWDLSLLSLAEISFGGGLGGPLFSFQSAVAGFGSMNAAELSLLFFPSDFLGLQDGSAFTLFSLTFNTIGVGTSTLGLEGNISGQLPLFDFIGGFFGAPLEAAPGTGTIDIIDRVAVPEPATLLLFMAGLLALGATRRRETG